MRVLMSLPDKRARGGTPSHLYLLRDALAKEGVEVKGFLYGGRTPDETVSEKVVARLRDVCVFAALIARGRPDVVHLNSAFDARGILRDSLFTLVARAAGPKVVVKFHGSDLTMLERASPVWRALIRIVMAASDAVCVLNSYEQTTFQARFPSTRVVAVKNALDLDRYEARTDFRSAYGISKDKPLLLFIARFIPDKGLGDVVEALPAVRLRHDVHAVFVGDGPERESAERRCRELGLSTCTTFTGHIPEERAVDAYRAATMLVFPTALPEGQPMVVFHALASGLPVVVTRFRAARDWLEEGKHCVFVPPHDPRSIASAITALLDDDERRTSLSREGRQVTLMFDKREVAREFASLYELICASL